MALKQNQQRRRPLCRSLFLQRGFARLSIRFAFLACLAGNPLHLVAAAFDDKTSGLMDLPEVPPGFEVALFAREPLVRNPCSMAFDAKGRMFVGMGPQYRNPRPDTPGDSVVIVLDTDGDGVADRTKIFATGFNCIQGLAWHGRDLWVGNAPDLMIVRDLDGDDEADEYVLVFTDLGNIEHGIHGLNWAPDGKLYMSKGNSKGLTQPGRVAPKPFRDLWGVTAPPGTPDFYDPRVFKKGEYKNTYHDPSDDWGREGGVLRCDDLGKNLEIVSRGTRNPWDITFDSGFNWLGTDNDQNEGDRIIMPFFGAHFGWGHAWSASWTGDGHLPTAPISGPVFHGSGTGLIYYDAPQFPENFRRVFFINDWLGKAMFVYRPRWDGALMQPVGGRWEEFARGSKALFRPTDIEVGPDGALYCLGWGTSYGVEWKDGEMANEGRIFRIAWFGVPALAGRENRQTTVAKPEPPKGGTPNLQAKRDEPLAQWSVAELIDDFSGPLPVWKIDAQDELVRRGATVKNELISALRTGKLSAAQETWTMWALGRMALGDASIDEFFARSSRREEAQPSTGNRQSPIAKSVEPSNLRLQSIRILAHRARESRAGKSLPSIVADLLNDPEPRVRFEAVQAIWQTKQTQFSGALADLAAAETDRLTFYSAWRALRDLASERALRSLLADSRGGVRRAALLALLDRGAMQESDVEVRLKDADAQTAVAAALWLVKHRGNPLIVFEPPAGEFRDSVQLRLTAGIKPSMIRYTFDGSTPTATSRRAGNISFDQTTTVKAALFVNDQLVGNIAEATYYRAETNAVMQPLEPLVAPTTLPQVLVLLPKADARRGEQLFFAEGGAACLKCHRVGARGNNFGPDLTDLSTRAEARHVIESLLNPNAVITEGFNSHLVETGENEYSGVLLEETGLALTLGLADGQRVRIERKHIKKHETLKTSAMPSFAQVLSPQQAADVTAWLLAQRERRAGVSPAQRDARQAAAEVAEMGRRDARPTLGFAFEQRDDRLILTHSGQLAAHYVFKDAKILRPFITHVHTPDGIQVTRNHPPVTGQDAVDHDAMHPGLWLAFGDISGHDFWRNKAAIRHERYAELPTVREAKLTFATESTLLGTNAQTLATLLSRITLDAQANGYLLIWDATFTPLTDGFFFGDQEEMGFGVRIATALTERNGGVLLSSTGEQTAKATWGKTFEWCDYSGVISNRLVGVTIMPDSQNFRPSWFHNRDYGLMLANPFGRTAFKQGERSAIAVARGATFRLRFGAFIHSSPVAQPPDLADAYRQFGAQTR